MILFIVLDSCDVVRLRSALDSGHLPNLAGIESKGRFLPVDNGLDVFPAEGPWAALWGGIAPQDSGFWTDYVLHPDYSVTRAPYDFAGVKPFFALDRRYRVAVIDPPQAPFLSDFHGIQLHAYGAHSHMGGHVSTPPSLRSEMIARYGAHPTLDRDYTRPRSPRRLAKFTEKLVEGCKRRARICADLLRQEPWDLFLCVFGESHVIAHWGWHTGSPVHPLYGAMHRQFPEDPWLTVARALDEAVGELVAAAPSDASIIVLSQEGMTDNGCDLPTNVFLPELLYRAHSGQAGLTEMRLDDHGPLPAVDTSVPFSGWVHEVWRTRVDRNPLRRAFRQVLPPWVTFHTERLFGAAPGMPRHPMTAAFSYKPPLWYAGEWPNMKFIALPSGSDAPVRINLKGRENSGVVAPEDYDSAIAEVVQLAGELSDARTGKRLLRRVTPAESLAGNGKRPVPDVILEWEPIPCDIAEHPKYGRIGPLPFERTGGHTTNGFAFLSGAASEAAQGKDRMRLAEFAAFTRELVMHR